MSERKFAAWVEPIAIRLMEARRQVAAMARALPSEAWQSSSPVPDWTYRDLLAHLAEGDVFCQMVIGAVLEDGPNDLRAQSAGREQRTAQILSEGSTRSIVELIEAVEREGEETQALLSRLADYHALRVVITSNSNPEPVTLGDFLTRFAHDEGHLADLRQATETAGSRQ